jgi:hypothetical protein
MLMCFALVVGLQRSGALHVQEYQRGVVRSLLAQVDEGEQAITPIVVTNPCGGPCTGGGSWQTRVDQPLGLASGLVDFTIEMEATLACHSDDCDPHLVVGDDDESWTCFTGENSNGLFATSYRNCPGSSSCGMVDCPGTNCVSATDLGWPALGVEFTFTCRFAFTGAGLTIDAAGSFTAESRSHTGHTYVHPPTSDELHAYFLTQDSVESIEVKTLQVSISTGNNDVAATGDPHLRNIHGERFDLMKPGTHVLVHIPREESAENALLRVEAQANKLGGQCEDIYFTELNITGSWASAKQAGGYRFLAQQDNNSIGNWVAMGKVELKVVHGHTETGTQYLNFYIKHLGRTGFAVGGLLGEEDHSDVSVPPSECVQRMSLGKSRERARGPGSAVAIAISA